MGKIKNSLKRLAQTVLPGHNPDFLIIGAQKAGTTSLHYYLDQHPRLAGSFPKELHYFSKHINYPNKDKKWYTKHFNSLTKLNPLYYESSPNYIYHEKAAQKIKEIYPKIKLVVLLRDPVERAFSGWNMYNDYFQRGIATHKLAKGISPEQENQLYKHLFKDRTTFPSFREVIDLELKFIEEGRKDGPNILRKGLYYDQLSNYYSYFDKTQILVIGFKELVKTPEVSCNRVLEFLKVKPDSWELHKAKAKNKRKYATELCNEDRAFLEKFYAEPNKKLFELLKSKPDW
jgi:hypothetical protein